MLRLLSVSLLFIAMVDGVRQHYDEADQQLHKRLHSMPVNSFISRTPRYNSTKKYDIVLLVISAYWERDERAEIRRQWASEGESAMQKQGDSLVIFLVSHTLLDPDANRREAAEYGDLLEIDVPEEKYRNLVYKIEAGFLWLKKNVKSDFVAKIDSDSVVHIDRLYRNMVELSRRPWKHWFACSSSYSAPLVRDRNSKWYIPEADYAPHYYPTYCSGAGYAMKRTTFDAIVERMGKHKVFEVEDAFFTGVVAQDFSDVHYLSGHVSRQYTTYSDCDAEGRPLLSIQNTEGQYSQYGSSHTDLTAAWKALKHLQCYRGWYRMINMFYL